MESKKISQLATELSPDLSDLTIIGDPTTGVSKKITLSQMASLFTGTIEEYANLASFPLTGASDTIYIALDTNLIYRWDVTAYVVLSPNIINSLVFSDANGFDGTITLVGSVATLSITTALTLGSVPFIGASGALTQDNSNLFFDDTNNRLGIATASPTTPLDVFGSGIIGRLNATSTNNSYLGFASNGTNKWSAGNVQSDHRFRIFSEANSAELVSVLQTGEFGIGIANPTTKFHIDGAATAMIANLDANVSVAKSVSFRSDNSARINLEVSGTESGSNAGADFFLRTFTDAGSLLETPFTIVRSTGVTTIKSLTLTNVLSVANGGTGSATQNFVDLTTTQSIGGAKTFTSALAGTSASFSSTATATAFIPSGATVPTNGMYLSAANTLDFATNTTNRLTIASTGAATFSNSAGITNGNGLNLRAGGNTASDANVLNFTSLAGTINVSMFSDASSSNTRLKSLGNLSFHTGNIAISADNERVTILSTGNVGIGTSIPSYLLDINGMARILRNGGDEALRISNDNGYIGFFNTANSTRSAYIQGNTTSLQISSSLAIPIQFLTSDAEKMRIGSNGAVTITSSIAGEVLLNVQNTSSTGNGLVIGAGSTSSHFVLKVENYNGTLDLFQVKGDGTVKINQLTSNGTVSTQSSNGTLFVSSDANLKIEDGYIENGLEKVLALKPRYFYWKDKEAFSADRQLGFYAQEVNAISEETANTPAEGCGWGIYDRGLVALLTAAIQEQQVQIQNLQEQINILSTK